MGSPGIPLPVFSLTHFLAGTGTHNLIRLTDFVDDVTHWLSPKTVDEKDVWLSALRKERQIVKSEENTGKCTLRSPNIPISCLHGYTVRLSFNAEFTFDAAFRV